MTDYKLVPVEPTEDMLVAGQEEWAHRPHGALEDCEEARSIYKAMLADAPAVQGEPVGWVNSDELDNMLDDRTATLFPVRTGFHGKPLYAAPQPAEQQPAACVGCDGAPGPENSPCAVCGQQPLPCQECGGDGAGGEHEEDCAMAQPAPDVSGLVEALSALRGCIMETRGHDAHSAIVLADAALAAHRKQGGE